MSAAEMTDRGVRIQPAEGPDRRLPYPFFVYERGRIGRQDVWKGSPLLLIGFSERQDAGEVDVRFEEFWADPSLAEGKYAVFEDADGTWGTWIGVIESAAPIEGSDS